MPLRRKLMRCPRLMHELAHLVEGKWKVKMGESKVWNRGGATCEGGGAMAPPKFLKFFFTI